MEWWAWIVLGVFLLGCELFVPLDFFLFFLGFSALVVGGLAGSGVVESPTMQWAVNAGIASLLVLVVRRQFKQRFGSGQFVAERADVVGEVATTKVALAPAEEGEAMLRGTVWKARNVGTGELAEGARAKVKAVDGLTLYIEKE